MQRCTLHSAQSIVVRPKFRLRFFDRDLSLMAWPFGFAFSDLVIRFGVSVDSLNANYDLLSLEISQRINR